MTLVLDDDQVYVRIDGQTKRYPSGFARALVTAGLATPTDQVETFRQSEAYEVQHGKADNVAPLLAGDLRRYLNGLSNEIDVDLLARQLAQGIQGKTVDWAQVETDLASLLSKHLVPLTVSVAQTLVPSLRRDIDTALSGDANEARQFKDWAHNNVKGKKGFQPKSGVATLNDNPEFLDLVNNGAVAINPYDPWENDTSYGSGAVLDHVDDVTEDQAIEAATFGLAWNTSTDSGDALSLHEAAKQRLNLTPTPGLGFDNPSVIAAGRLLDGNRGAIDRAFPSGTVQLYRGTSQNIGMRPDGSRVVMLKPLSSWTTSQSEAASYGTNVISAVVPTTRIAGLPGYGLGNSVHQEVVVYGGRPLEVTLET